MRLDWDAPASKTFANGPAMPLRVYVYRLCLYYGYPQVTAMFHRCGINLSSSALRSSMTPLIEKHPILSCKRCGKKTTSTTFCSTCSIAAEQGTLTERERQRLKEHYANARSAYAETREREHSYLEDEYTNGSQRHASRHDSSQ